MSDSFVTPLTVAFQGPLSMGFPRQEYWSGLLLPPLGDLPNPGIKSASPALAGGFLTAEPPGKSPVLNDCYYYLVSFYCFLSFPRVLISHFKLVL